MKKFHIVIALILGLAIVTVTTVIASGSLPGNGWWSGEQIQNIGDTTAEIVIRAYDTSSTAIYSSTKSVESGASFTFIPSDFPGMGSSFIGSAVVTSNQEIRAITNVTNREIPSLGYGVAGGQAAAQYQGMHEIDQTLYFPLSKNDVISNTTTFYIQNAGTISATAHATFNVSGSTYTYNTPLIAPGRMVVVTPSDASVPAGYPNGLGSAVFTSTQQIAGTVLEHKTTENPSTHLTATRGFIPDDGDTKAYAPIIKNNYYDRFSQIAVMNTNITGNVNITVTYHATDHCDISSPYQDIITGILPQHSHIITNLTGQTNVPDDCLVTAEIESGGGEVVAVVTESWTDAKIDAGNNQEMQTYSAFPANSATTIISVPLYKEYAYGKWTGCLVQNVSDTQANVYMVLTGPTGTYTTTAKTIEAGAGLNFIDQRLKDAIWWDGTQMDETELFCTVDGCQANGTLSAMVFSDQNVVAIANESPYVFASDAASIDQDKNNYEGFNLIPIP